MTTGEIIGIAVGVAGLGVAGALYWKSTRIPPPPPPATTGSTYTNPNPYGTTSLQIAPTAPSSGTQQTINDVNAWIGAGANAIGQGLQLFQQFSSIFG